MKPSVYVVLDGDHEYQRAESYGEVKFLFEGKVNVFASDRLKREVSEKLSGSSPDDFLILSGNMLAAALVFHEMMRRHGQANVLLYSFKRDAYEVRTIRSGGDVTLAAEQEE